MGKDSQKRHPRVPPKDSHAACQAALWAKESARLADAFCPSVLRTLNLWTGPCESVRQLSWTCSSAFLVSRTSSLQGEHVSFWRKFPGGAPRRPAKRDRRVITGPLEGLGSSSALTLDPGHQRVTRAWGRMMVVEEGNNGGK